jgi:hypothetical protein
MRAWLGLEAGGLSRTLCSGRVGRSADDPRLLASPLDECGTIIDLIASLEA